MTARLLSMLLLVLGGPVLGGPVLAQSAPPDLQPRLSGKPVLAQPVEEKEKPKLREPPRSPVVPDAMTPLPTAAPSR